MRRRISRLGPVAAAAVALAVVLLTYGLPSCGVQPTGIVSAGSPPQAAAPNVKNQLYFVKNGKLEPVLRVGLPTDPTLAVWQIMTGPTQAERARGLTTVMPPVFPDYAEGDVMYLHVEHPVTDRSWPKLARAQLACTAAVIPGVKRVELSYYIAETDKETLSRFRCSDYSDLMP